jgi:hypothetical protein
VRERFSAAGGERKEAFTAAPAAAAATAAALPTSRGVAARNAGAKRKRGDHSTAATNEGGRARRGSGDHGMYKRAIGASVRNEEEGGRREK